MTSSYGNAATWGAQDLAGLGFDPAVVNEAYARHLAGADQRAGAATAGRRVNQQMWQEGFDLRRRGMHAQRREAAKSRKYQLLGAILGAGGQIAGAVGGGDPAPTGVSQREWNDYGGRANPQW